MALLVPYLAVTGSCQSQLIPGVTLFGVGLNTKTSKLLAEVEHDYGTQAFETVLSTATELVTELRGAEVRTNDILTVNSAFDATSGWTRLNTALRVTQFYTITARLVNGRLQVLAGAWHVRALPALEAAFDAGERSPTRAVAALPRGLWK